MSYCATTDVADRIGRPFAWGSQNGPTADRGQDTIASGDAVIDGYCRERYEVPFATPVPEIIVRISTDLAASETMGIVLKASGDDKLRDYWRGVGRDALALLRDIQAGRVSVLAGDDAAVSATGFADASTEPDPIFTRDTEW